MATKPPTSPPAGTIFASQIIGMVPLTIDFMGLMTHTPSSWVWDFGDGKKQSFKSPDNSETQNASLSHTYTDDGVFTVNLTGTNSVGTNLVYSAQIIVTKPNAPNASFTATPIVSSPLTINFVGSSTGNPLGWLWDFGDSSNSRVKNPTHIYKKAGTYTVNYVEIHSNGAYKTSTQTIVVVDNMLSAILSAYGLIIGITTVICILLIISCIASMFMGRK